MKAIQQAIEAVAFNRRMAEKCRAYVRRFEFHGERVLRESAANARKQAFEYDGYAVKAEELLAVLRRLEDRRKENTTGVDAPFTRETP